MEVEVLTFSRKTRGPPVSTLLPFVFVRYRRLAVFISSYSVARCNGFFLEASQLTIDPEFRIKSEVFLKCLYVEYFIEYQKCN